MLRSMLIGLDGSPSSDPAVELAIAWAKRFGSLVVGVGVVDEPGLRGTQHEGRINPSYQAAYQQLLTEARHHVEQALEKFAIRCSMEQVAFKLLEDEGQPCERIVTELERYDLLLLGRETHFRHGSEQHPCGTLEQIVRQSPRPVVVVPEHAAPQGEKPVLVAYDGSIQAARALQVFVVTGLAALGQVQVVTIHPDSSIAASQIAERAVEFLRFHDIAAVRVPLTGAGSAGKRLLEKATQDQAALLVLGAYGQPRLAEFFLGSATRTALQETSVPLFLHH